MYKFIPIDKFIKDVKTCASLMPHYDFKVSAIVSPELFALSAWCPDPYDQASLGSCTANGILGVVKMTDGVSDNNNDLELSRLFLYTHSLLLGNPGKPLEDTGSDAAVGCTVLATIGVAEEKYMPYTLDASNKVVHFGQFPSAEAMANASLHKYEMFKNVTWNGDKFETIKACISTGWPVLIAVIVFPSFNSKEARETGYVPMPSEEELKGSILGGHQLVAVDYDSEYITCLNSYGSSWGYKGFVKFPVAYLSKTFPIPQGVLQYCQQLLILKKIPDFQGQSKMSPQLLDWTKTNKPIVPSTTTNVEMILTKINESIMSLFNLQMKLNKMKVNSTPLEIQECKQSIDAIISELQELNKNL